jgi:hypothetical protein
VKKKVANETTEEEGNDPIRRVMVNLIRKVKDQLKHVWNDAQNFGVSNEVFMVEIEVMHRLRSDGVMSPCSSDKITCVCFYVPYKPTSLFLGTFIS